MHEHEVPGDRAVYDHETEDPRAPGRRRRVADWGVGEELFDRMPSPRRRFNASDPARRDSHPRERRFEPAQEDAGAHAAPAADLDTPTRELVSAAREAAKPRAAAAPTARKAATPREAATPRGGIEGRRTVVIGRQSAHALPVRRERPSRSVGERLGHRPDRLASYAVALGLLLIIIAFLSS
jgi:hypothetical protein